MLRQRGHGLHGRVVVVKADDEERKINELNKVGRDHAERTLMTAWGYYTNAIQNSTTHYGNLPHITHIHHTSI